MSSVKRSVRHDEANIAMLAGRLLDRRVRPAFEDERWQGLRQSHLRLLHLLPEEGATITEHAAALRMTKQGCGQLVRRLEELGYVATAPDADDRRVRRVRRTRTGDEVVAAVAARFREIEAEMADLVGPRRYATFRAVLEELGSAKE